MEDMIILYTNHKCGIDDPNNLEKYRDDTNVFGLLFPVDLYAPEYVLLYPDKLPRQFKKFVFEYTLSVESYSECGYFYRDCDTQTIVCNTTSELIRFVASIYKLHGFNSVSNSSDFDSLITFTLEDMKIFRKGKNRDRFWNVKEECHSENASEIATILDILNYVVNKNVDHNIIPPVSVRDTIFINSKKCKWSTNKGDKHDLKSIPLMNFNMITFISDEDYEMLKNVDLCAFTQIPFVVFDDMNIPYDHINSTIMYQELDQEYLDIYPETETQIYEVAALVEILINIRQIKMSRMIMDEVAYGCIGVDHLYEIEFSLKKDPNKKKDSCRPVYKFALRDRDIENRDYYDDFMVFLAERMIKHAYRA